MNKLLALLLIMSCAQAQDTLKIKIKPPVVVMPQNIVLEYPDSANATLIFEPEDTLFYRYTFEVDTVQEDSIPPDTSGQSWQEMLEDSFDIVETFDLYENWKGSKPQDVVHRYDYENEFPGQLWDYYTNHNDTTYNFDWIGSDDSFSGSKSLCIDYIGVKGAGRYGFHIGDSPEDGYDDVYVFFMNKWFKDFFLIDENSFLYHGFLKTFQISTGFRDEGNWGTIQEQQTAQDSGAATQVLYTYGLNFVVMNFYGGGTERGKYNTHTAKIDFTGYNYEYEGQAPGADFSQPILNNEWFGIEYRFKKGTPDSSDGLIEIWVYDKNGNQIGYDSLQDVVFRNANLNHKWNKFIWGGNRHYTLFDNQEVNHLYIDDIIVDDKIIAENYFKMRHDYEN